MASLRNDPLGKGMAQILLSMPVRVPRRLLPAWRDQSDPLTHKTRRPTMKRKPPRKSAASVLAAIAGATLLAAVPALHAQTAAYPNKPIRLVVAFGTGSGNDIIARDLARYMSDILGQSMVVENRTGGGGSVGTDAVAKAAPDGYTIGLGTSSQLVMNVGLYKSLPFDVERDLRSIGLVARTPLVLVASSNAHPEPQGS